MAVSKSVEYQMFKGLQRPLEFLGLQGRYITWTAITAISALLIFIVVYTLLGFLFGLIALGTVVSVGAGLIIVKQRKGLYTKKCPKGIFVYAYSERL